jgi:hypothetical protein
MTELLLRVIAHNSPDLSKQSRDHLSRLCPEYSRVHGLNLNTKLTSTPQTP